MELCGRFVGRVRRIVRDFQEERLAAVFLQELDRLAGFDLGTIRRFVFFAHPVRKPRIVAAPNVEQTRVALAEMPLADICRVIARRAEQFRVVGAQLVLRQRENRLKPIDVVVEPVRGGIDPGQQRGAGRRANRLRNIGVGKANALRGEAVEMRRVDEWIAVRANGVAAPLIGKNEQKIRPRPGCGGRPLRSAAAALQKEARGQNERPRR